MTNPPSPPPPPSPAGGSGDPYQQPGYGQGPTGYGPPQPGYNQPQQGYEQAPQPGYSQPAPGYNQPAPGYSQPQGHDPYAAGAYGSPAPYEQNEKKKGRGLLIGGGIAASLLLVGGGVFAATALLGSSGTHPYEVLPQDAFYYAEVDFDPEADQKTAYLNIKDQLIEKFNFDEDADLFEALAEPLGSDIDYDADVEPWLGDRFGLAVVQDADEPEGFVAFASYQIADADKLGEARDKFDTSSLVQGEYLIVSNSDREEVLPESGFGDVLADRDGFTSSLDELDGNTIASMWLDLGSITQLAADELADDMALQNEFGELPDFEVSGTVVAGVHLDNSFVQAQIKALDIETAEDAFGDIKLNKGEVAKVLKSMPNDAGIALAVGGLDEYVNLALEEFLKSPEMADVSEILESSLRELRIDADIFLPETVTGILGTTTGIYVSESGGALYADGGDEALLSQIGSALSELGEQANISTEGSTVVVSGGNIGEGQLGENANFDKALRDLDNAHFALYVDPDTMDPYMEDIGIIGVTGQVENNGGDLTVRWVLP